MLNIPAVIKSLFESDSALKNFRVHFPNGELPDITNANIVRDSVRFTESICSRDYLQFGLSEQSQMEFETVGIGNIYGYTIECYCEIDTSSLDSQYQTFKDDVDFPVYSVPYGTFVVTNCPRQRGKMKHRRVTAYSIVDPIEDWSIVGAHPNRSIKIHPDELIAMIGLTTDQMDSIPQIDQMDLRRGYAGFTSNGNDSLALNPTNNKFGYVAFRTSYSGARLPDTTQKMVLNVHYDKSDNDGDLSAKQYKSAVDACPNSTSYVYDYQGTRVAKNAKQGFALSSGFLKPFYRIDRAWSGGGSAYGYPHTLEPDTNILIDWANEPIPYKSGNCTGDIVSVTIFVCIPTRWYSNAIWNTNNNTYYPENWPVPTETQRSGTQSAYIKVLDEPNEDIPSILVNATLKVNEPALGTYYTYANAFSPLNFLNGYLECVAKFLRTSRAGSLELVELDSSDPYELDMSHYQDCWWDEYDVSPVGTVVYKFGDGRYTVRYEFGEGKSVYEMTDNYFLNHLAVTDDIVEKINALLDTYFVPKLSNLSFTPVDLTAMGLPFLEAGDYLRIIVDNNEAIYTYIMRREIDGVQTLTDDITSTGGEIIEEGVRNI